MESTLTLSGTPSQLSAALLAFDAAGSSTAMPQLPAITDLGEMAEIYQAIVQEWQHDPDFVQQVVVWFNRLVNHLAFNDPYQSKDKNLPDTWYLYPKGPVLFGALLAIDVPRAHVLIRVVDKWNRPSACKNSDDKLTTRVSLRTEESRADATFLIEKAYEAYEKDRVNAKRGRA